MTKYILLTFALICTGCQTPHESRNLRDLVSGKGELRLTVKFEGKRTTDVNVYIDDNYVGEFVAQVNSNFATYHLPAGLRAIRVEATHNGKRICSEHQILILGDDTRQTLEATLVLK